jgi:hypothetical protein
MDAGTPQSPARQPNVTLHRVTDVDPEELEHIARSFAMAPVLDERDRQAVIDALRRLAAIERAKRRHPAGGSPRSE